MCVHCAAPTVHTAAWVVVAGGQSCVSLCVRAGISGAYDLEGLAGHLHSRGLYNNLFSQVCVCGGVECLCELIQLVLMA